MPLETVLTDRHQAQLAQSGLTLLFHRTNTNQVVCLDAPSLQKPVTYTDDEATQNARRGAKLLYLFAASRFAQYEPSPPKEIRTPPPQQARTQPPIIAPGTVSRPWWSQAVANIRAWLGRTN